MLVFPGLIDENWLWHDESWWILDEHLSGGFLEVLILIWDSYFFASVLE